MKPSTKHRIDLFVAEYVKNGQNATKAALTIGMSPKTAYSQGHTLLKRAETQAALAAFIRRKEYDAEQCLGELDKAYEVAERKQNPIAMTGASLAKAKVAGLLIERFADVTDRTGLRDRAESTLSALGVSSTGIAEIVPHNATSGDCGQESGPDCGSSASKRAGSIHNAHYRALESSSDSLAHGRAGSGMGQSQAENDPPQTAKGVEATPAAE
jgi:hypothetical protein